MSSSSRGRPTKGSSGSKASSSSKDSNSSSSDLKSRSKTMTNPSTDLGTPKSKSTSGESLNRSFLPYQYKRELKIPSELRAHLPPREDLELTHRPIRLGLGTPQGNLKVHHIVNSKKDSLVNNTKKTFIRGSSRKPSDTTTNLANSSKTTPGGNTGNGITSRMKMLTIYESPKCSPVNEIVDSSSTPSNSVCKINSSNSVAGKVFLTLNKKANLMAAFNKSVTFTVGGKKSVTVPQKNKSSQDGNNRAVYMLCRHFKNILAWKLGIHMNWKYLEEKIKTWYASPPTKKLLSVEEIADLLKVSSDQIRQFKFSPDMEITFNILRKNLSHTTLPTFSKLLALQKIQNDTQHYAARYASEHCGMYLQSEIVDKHFTFINRIGEAKEKDKQDKLKSEVYLEHAQETLDFSNSCFDSNKNVEREFRQLSTFESDWNIVQLSTGPSVTNRFGYDIIGKRGVPQLILSAFGFLPNQSLQRNEFTTFCLEPPMEAGSSMRFGLFDSFDKLLDKNLVISDDKTIVSRKKYWEERSRHNDYIEAVMDAMEDWLFPWTFLLPGTVKDKLIWKKIELEVLSDKVLSKCSDSQKFGIYRLTDCYNLLPVRTRNVLDTLVAFILNLDEEAVQSLTKKIAEVGSCISPVESRNPTILILDQDIDIFPWDWLTCLRTTSVTRMPSLNLIKSTIHMTKYLEKVQRHRAVDRSLCTYILNPDGSLPQVQKRLEQYFSDRKTWIPVVARSPTAQEMQNCLENQHVLVYCGHGSGTSFFPEYAVQKLICKAIPLLMGCSSAQSHFVGPGLYAYSSVHAYFTAGCTSIVGFLWEVTDTECDRITVDLLERWLPHPSAKLPEMPIFDSKTKREHEAELSSAVRKARTSATQLLTQCAAVCYGIPGVKTIDI